MKVLIIIPAYNEDENIIKLIKIIQNEHANINIILIDDSNNFTTKRNIENYKFSNLKYIKRNMKMGRGSAIRYGFEYANEHSFDYTFEMDSDCSHDPNEIKFLLQKITNKNYDLVIGSRYLKKSKIIGWPIKRKIFSRLANLLAQLLFGFDISDYTNGFRVYNSRSITELLKYKIKNNGFIYLTETLIILKKKKYRIGEYPTIFINRKFGSSSVKFKEIINSLLGIFKIKFRKI